MPQIDFFYFFGSCYAYLSVMRIEKLAEEAGVEVRWRPFSVRDLMTEKGYFLRTQPTKMDYIFRDVERRARLHGIPFEKPPIWPTDPDQLANRAGIAAFIQGWGREYTKTSFRAWFDGMPLGAEESLNEILTSLGKEPQSIIDLANSPEIRERYNQETDAARQLGIFGSPTFAVGQEIFWGDDRLEEALAWAKGQHPALLR
ncbi:2-hydroxychromene-2-carboxylate isomerase [Microvirga aerophila]|uniref:2-hydroxychromene-2-carboxylate isomerase n=1 Tax=Microvirga aerophila TaxID=670291 RepID=A0A512BVS5_9HYPH|nr:2-hydroxychromene-2-carboxylate isomerase [Microvirga aerophila]GEO16062.1 2-hydroxychromene-2-carboxylate isomerase [Microvirga aerophila]